MNIGFDLDKIFIDYPPFVPDILIDRLYKQNSNRILLYRIPSEAEQLIRIISHYPLFRPPITKNIRFAEDLSKTKKHKHFLLSSRFSFLKKRTEVIVKKYQFDKIFDGMFFNFENKQPHLFKNEVIRKLTINRYIDDDLPLLEFLAQKNPKVKFFWLNQKESKPLGKNLFAIAHLSEMFNKNVYLRGSFAPSQHLEGGRRTPSR